MAELINVMAAKVDDKVALWERHPDHPTGEVWIVGDGTQHEVALTPRVVSLLKSGVLIRMQVFSEPDPLVTTEAESTITPTLPTGYESMTAADVVADVDSWTTDEIAAAREYEQANKARVTVLKALG
jgi:hypothetical protein